MSLGINGLNNTSSLFALNAMRLSNLTLNRTMSQLSSGQRLINAGIDPSGLAISTGFQSRMGGLNQAIYNSQDTINMTRTAESTMSSQSDILMRMRDLAVRSSNDATLSASDQTKINNEFQSLKTELTRSGQAATYNTKNLTTDVAGQQYGTQTAQIGPDNNASNQLDITINPSTAASMGLAASDVSTTAGAQNAIDEVSAALDTVSSQRSNLGITENRLGYTINDLSNQNINLAESNSRIADTQMEQTITEMNNAQIHNQLGISMLRQSNAQAMGVLKLLGA